MLQEIKARLSIESSGFSHADQFAVAQTSSAKREDEQQAYSLVHSTRLYKNGAPYLALVEYAFLVHSSTVASFLYIFMSYIF